MPRKATVQRTAQAATLRLVPAAGPDQNTIDCLRALLRKAEDGEIIGLAYAAVYSGPGGHYTVHACGEAHRKPTFTLGMVQMLIDELTDRIRAGAC